jgi:TP901 family phage tail tape measure protein
MARTITDEKIKLSIIVDGNPAQKELFELEKSVRDLNTQQKELRKEKQLLEKQGLRDTERYKAVTAAIKDNTLAITASKAKMGELQNQLGLTGLTMGQLQQKATALRAVLRNMVPGSENFRNVQNELNQVTGRIDELRGRATAARFSIGSMADSFNRYQGIAISAIAATTGIVLSIQKIIDINGKLSDAQADVMKTTGMTKVEVDELTKSFGLLQTRTSRIDLLKIAEQGGRIGIIKEDIGQFVEVMNKASVALGDSFTGGAEEVANKLGKIKFLFEETKNLNVDEAYNSIGSAINDLGANGVASEANIAEFTTRIGSLTDVLKPTIQETLALGTAFEESGIEAEVSARAYNIFMKQASTESAKFAQVMGLTTKEVEAMINKNPLDFMMKFAEGMRGMDATQTAKTLDFLGVNADGANKVIGAMGNNMARFKELIDLSNNSFAEGTSLIAEYDIKNNNLAATLEKVGKKVSGWFSSEGFNKWLFNMVNGFAILIGATEDVSGAGQKWRNTLVFIAKMIAVVTSALITNVGWQKLVALWTTRNTEANLLYTIASKARAVADAISIIGTQALAAAQMLLTGNLRGATQAFRVMTATMMTTPWGFILGALAAIGTAYVMFSEEAKEAASAQSMMADTSKKTADLVAKESQTFMTLMKVVQDTTASTEARTEALKKAKEIGGEYTKGLTLENATTAEGTKMIDAYIQSLQRKMQLQVLEAKQKELLEQMQDRKNKNLDEEVGFWDKLWAGAKNFGNASLASADVVVTASKRKSDALAELQRKLNFTNAEMAAFLKKNPNLINNIGGGATSDFKAPGETGTGTETKNPNSSLQELLKLRLDNERKFADEALKIQRQIEDDKIAIMQDGYEKENAIEALRYQREIDDLNRQKVNALEMAKLDEDIAKAKEDKDVTKYNALLNIKKFWEQKNQDLDAKMQELIKGKFAIHQTKLAIIQEKGAKTQLQLDKEAFDRAKVIRETKFQEQLAALGDNQRAKEKLTQEFNKSELDIEEAFLKELIGKLNDIVGKKNIGKIDLDLLTPEQVDKFKEQAEKAGLSLQEFINKRNQLLHGEAVDNAQALGVAQQSTDILGFTSDNWQVFFDNLSKGKMGIDEMVFAVGALTNAYSMYNEFLSANENAQLRTYQRNSDAKKRKLKQELDSGMINQRQYKAGIEKIDDDLDKKKLDLEYKQAKRQKIIAAMNIVNSTAQAIIGIWAQFPKFDFGATAAIMSGVVGALGALQLATVLAQPLPARGAEKGLYPEYVKREQDGKVFRTTGTSGMKTGLYSKPRLLVGEGPGDMPEMVIDKRSYAELSPYTKSLLIRELRGVRGFEQGYYNPASMRIETPASSGAPSSNDQLLQMVLGVVAQNTEVMKNLRDNGVTGKFFRNDLKSMKEINEGIKDYNELRNKAKK